MKLPKMTIVHGSSQISEIGYDKELQNLFITFSRKDKTYVYYGVSSEVWERLSNSPSVGSYFSQKIRNAYDYKAL